MSVTVIDHPLIQHKLTLMRDRTTGPKDFRELLEEIAMLMAYEVTRTIALEDIQVQGPLGPCDGKTIAGKKLGVIPILRAGLGMVGGILRLVPNAKVGHIGLYRDESTLQPVEYYCKLPEDLSERDLFLLDPMLATGGSAAAAVEFLKKRGARSKNIKFLCLLCSPRGIEVLQKSDPEVDIYTASIDQSLNERGYILPGLGDAGDRLFGTM
ncbi:uracil phosphoribosyltransferase [bacterium]|nr:uracil phosphoribosyltransferase [bacterium]